MSRVLIVVTSYREKDDRIFTGDEWCDGWRFSNLEDLRIRTESRTKPEPVKSFTELHQHMSNEDAIIWIRGKDSNEFPSAKIAELIRKLRKTNEVYLSYHDPFAGRGIASEFGGQWSGMVPYSLSKRIKPEKFKGILKTDRKGEKYLDSEGNFTELFLFFFLKPTDVFPVVLHKINGILSVIDLDLQYFQDKRYSTDAWKYLKEKYEGHRGTEKLKECNSVVYQDPISLKLLYEGESMLLPKEKRTQLQSRWEHLTRLLPEEETAISGSTDPMYVEVEKVIKALDEGPKAEVQKNFEGGNRFREWMDSLENAINGIKEVIMTAKSEPVSV